MATIIKDYFDELSKFSRATSLKKRKNKAYDSKFVAKNIEKNIINDILEKHSLKDLNTEEFIKVWQKHISNNNLKKYIKAGSKHIVKNVDKNLNENEKDYLHKLNMYVPSNLIFKELFINQISKNAYNRTTAINTLEKNIHDVLEEYLKKNIAKTQKKVLAKIKS